MPSKGPKVRNGLRYFSSDLLDSVKGLTHAFPCRSGLPDEPLDTLAGRILDAFDMAEIVMAHQVHGTELVVFDGPSHEARDAWETEADGVVTVMPNVAAGVRTADCVPVLMAEPGARVVAAVHAGWRGMVDGIIQAAVGKMRDRFDARPENILAVVGPHIRQCCFEIGPEVAEVFVAKFGGGIVRAGKGDHSFANLDSAAVAALFEAGLRRERIDSVGECTKCRADLFYSYRRDGDGTGRQLSFIYFSK